MSKKANDELEELAHRLFGDRWQRRMSRAYGIADRKVSRWASRELIPSEGILNQLREDVARAEAANLDGAVAALARDLENWGVHRHAVAAALRRMAQLLVTENE